MATSTMQSSMRILMRTLRLQTWLYVVLVAFETHLRDSRRRGQSLLVRHTILECCEQMRDMSETESDHIPTVRLWSRSMCSHVHVHVVHACHVLMSFFTNLYSCKYPTCIRFNRVAGAPHSQGVRSEFHLLPQKCTTGATARKLHYEATSTHTYTSTVRSRLPGEARATPSHSRRHPPLPSSFPFTLGGTHEATSTHAYKGRPSRAEFECFV